MLVVGYPNVGKSSLINHLRDPSLRRAGPRVAPTPGYTRRISSFLASNSPPLLLLDTPGVMLPSFTLTPQGQSTALKLALVRAFKDALVPYDTLARFLLLTLNSRTRGGGGRQGEGGYAGAGVLEGLVRTEDVDEMVEWVARKIDAFGAGKPRGLEQGEGEGEGKGGEGRKERAVRFLLRKFRVGEMGPVMLDDVEEEMERMREAEREKEEAARLRRERRAYESKEGHTRTIRIVTVNEHEGGQQHTRRGEEKSGG